jgi:hypothetical protein
LWKEICQQKEKKKMPRKKEQHLAIPNAEAYKSKTKSITMERKKCRKKCLR